MHGKSTTVLEMEHNIIDFITLCENPFVAGNILLSTTSYVWSVRHSFSTTRYFSDIQDPYSIVILLQNDLVLIDAQTNGFPSFENPYPMDIHESPVTCCSYFADCPSDIIPAFYSVGRATQKRPGFSDKEWPISGGEWSLTSCSYNEIIITGYRLILPSFFFLYLSLSLNSDGEGCVMVVQTRGRKHQILGRECGLAASTVQIKDC